MSDNKQEIINELVMAADECLQENDMKNYKKYIELITMYRRGDIK